LAQHPDVGPGAEHPLLQRRDDHRADLGVLEAEPLDGVGELDVDAEVVRVELQLVAGPEPAVLPDVHPERRHAPVDRELPVPVAGGLGPEVDQDLATVRHGRLELRPGQADARDTPAGPATPTGDACAQTRRKTHVLPARVTGCVSRARRPFSSVKRRMRSVPTMFGKSAVVTWCTMIPRVSSI